MTNSITSRPLRIGIVAGEASGDILGANFIKNMNAIHPNIEWYGVGGKRMLEQGFSSLFAMERLSVMGIVEVLKHLPDLLKAKKELITELTDKKIDIFVGIDAPDFNLKIAKQLKKQKVHTVQYVSPSVWAWREGRIHNIMQSTHQVLCLFPFELEVYKKYNHPAVCVGHPLLENISATTAAENEVLKTACQKILMAKFTELNIDTHKKVVGLLPGSRHGEVQKIAPALFEAALLLLQKQDVQFIVPAVNHALQAQLIKLLQQQPKHLQQAVTILVDGDNKTMTCSTTENAHVTTNFSHQVMRSCDCIAVASGTVTLESLLLNTPMVVVYKLNNLTYSLAKRLVKIPYVSLANIIAQKQIVAELIQDAANPENIAAHVYDLLQPTNNEQQKQLLKETENKLRTLKAESAATAVLDFYQK